MDVNDEPWEKGVPPDLIPAIDHLRGSFHEAQWGCGRTTRIFCYAALHDEAPDDPDKGLLKYLRHIQNTIPFAEAREFADLLKMSTPPAIYKAYYDLYVNGTGVQALDSFANLIQIGRANEDRLSVPFLVWAETQAKHLIRSKVHRIRMWVQQVCHKQITDPNEDAEQEIFWRKWQAPSLIIMTPSRRRPYEAEKAWELNDPETSARWLKGFEDDYVLRLEMKIRKVAGEAAVALAKQPKQTHRGAADPVSPSPNQEDGARGKSAPDKHSTSNTVRREARKLETEAKYRRWQAEYRRLKRRRKGKPDVWYAQQIAKLPIADGSSAETIRRHMTEK